MAHNYPDKKKEVETLSRELAQGIPNTISAFSQLHRTALAAGAPDTKSKELMSLAIAISSRCTGCIAAHVGSALKHGATREEMLETIGVAVMMGGGPSLVYGCEALEAIKQFTSDTD